MFIATVIVTAVLALVCLASGSSKIKGVESLTGQLTSLGVPAARIPLLGSLLVAGALGVLAGLWWAPIGIAASACLALYFVGAIVAHLRAGDKNVAPVVVLTLLSVAALVLRVVTA